MLALLAAGCGNQLPPASVVEKLRVLAVRAEPPEVTPGMTTQLDALVVQPPVHQLEGPPPVGPSYLWLACKGIAGAAVQSPCGLQPGATAGSMDFPQVPPCAANPGAGLCVIGQSATGSYTPDDSSLDIGGTGQIFITLVVDDTADGAIGCLTRTADNGGTPPNPDHCVLAIKRLAVSQPGRTLNHNPGIDQFTLAQSTDDPKNPLRLDTNIANWPVSTAEDKPAIEVEVTRAADASEPDVRPDPRDTSANPPMVTVSEALSISYFASAGTWSGGRSAFAPSDEGCATWSDCPMTVPKMTTTSKWTPPNDEQRAMTVAADDLVRFWVVIRDDRGGVGWKEGTAKKR
jgi:hypothetical protein